MIKFGLKSNKNNKHVKFMPTLDKMPTLETYWISFLFVRCSTEDRFMFRWDDDLLIKLFFDAAQIYLGP